MGDDAFNITDNWKLSILSFKSDLPVWTEETKKVDQKEFRTACDRR